MHLRLPDHLVCPFTRQPLRLEVIRGGSDRVDYGVLWSEIAEFPILSGIPVLLPDQDEVVELLWDGDLKGALSRAVLGPAPMSGARKLASRLGEGRLLGPIAQTADNWLAQRDHSRAVSTILRSGTDPVTRLIAAGFHAQRTELGAVGYREACNYFRYRYGAPRYLVGLSYIEWLPIDAGTVLDLGCGAGHLAWQLTLRSPASRVIGLDREFFLLLVGKRYVAPQAEFVCGDAAQLPLRDGHLDAVFSSDVFSVLPDKWRVLREIERVLTTDGWMALTSLTNADCDHEFAGLPLSPGGWRLLVEHLDHRLLPDRVVLESYWERRGVPAGRIWEDGELSGEPLLSLVATKGSGGFRDGPEFSGWPHARGALGVNPLYRVASVMNGAIAYERFFPSRYHERDNRFAFDYLPQRFTLSRSAIKRAEQGDIDDSMEALIASCAVIGYPPRLLQDPWLAGSYHRPEAKESPTRQRTTSESS
ncbi:MAG: methyltransferase domain-containing protein [Nitriliruptorales bacterium]